MFQFYEFASTKECNTALITAILELINKLLLDKDRVHLAFSGGKSPIAFLEMLSKQECNWKRCNVSLVDERIVDLSSEESNARLIKTYFLQNSAKNSHFTPFFEDLNLSLEALVENANACYHQPDIAILGMGLDGHTASLFAEADEFQMALETACNIVLINPKNAPYKRLSMSLSALKKCKKLFLCIATEEKYLVFNEAIKGLNQKIPISYILHSREVMCDVYFSK
ncbi:6-phosphogluconolactonase [Helicobacter mesocricetorum]|uniref:6-phosphogluconolactonase n=1 Tax=Helicobacter mesocricetorum TaxID=87012 RepID=UPI001F1BEB1C|nr:6-phosphogluconolactonase [Helicobacter mesocricetorum]